MNLGYLGIVSRWTPTRITVLRYMKSPLISSKNLRQLLAPVTSIAIANVGKRTIYCTCKIIFFLKHTVYIIQWRAFQKNIIFIYLCHLSSFFPSSWSMVFCLGPPRTMKNRTGRSLLECTSFLPGSTASRRPRGKVFPFPMKRIHGTIVGRFTYHLRDDCVFT